MADTALDQVRDEMRAWRSHTGFESGRLLGWADAIDAAIKQRERDKGDAARYRWLAQYPNLYTVNDLLRADQYATLTRACDALMSVAAMATESGNGR